MVAPADATITAAIDPAAAATAAPGGQPAMPLVTDLQFEQAGRLLTPARWPHIPPMPPQPYRRYQWFNEPAVAHLCDLWLWYRYVSGLPAPQALALAAPLLALSAALAAGAAVCLHRARRAGGLRTE